MTEREENILKAILEIEPTGAAIEDIVEKTGITKLKALYILLLLEIKDKVIKGYIHGDGFILEVYHLTKKEYQNQIQVHLWDFFSSGLHEQKV